MRSTQTAAGSDTAEDTENKTVLVQMEEEERAIRAMPFVTTLSFVRAVKGKAEGWRVTLTCFACREYNSCGKKQEASLHISGERPTLLACLQELRKRLEEHHGNCAQALTEKDAADTVSAATVRPDTATHVFRTHVSGVGHKFSGGNARQLERVARRGLPPRGSEASTSRRGGSRRTSYARRGSEKASGCR